MSVMDRIKAVAEGIKRTPGNVIDLGSDVVRAAYDPEEDEEGFIEAWMRVVRSEAATREGARGRGLQRGISRQTREEAADLNTRIRRAGQRRRPGGLTFGTEQAYGAVPEGVRAPARQVGRGVIRAPGFAINKMDQAYTVVVDRPLAAVMTAASLYDSDEYMQQLEGLSTWERAKRTWDDAWQTSESRSWGDALAFAFLTDDITDQQQVDEAYGSGWFRTISTVGGVGTAFALDPTAAAFDVSKIMRQARLAREAQAFVSGADNLRSVDKLYARTVQAPDAGALRDDLFPSRNAIDGNAWANALYDASRLSRPDFNTTLRALMQQPEAIAELATRHADLVYQVGVLTEGRNSLQYKWGTPTKTFEQTGRFHEGSEYVAVAENNRNWFNIVDAAVTQTNSAAARLERTLALEGTVRTIPRHTRTRQLQQRVTASEFYRSSPFGAPLRVVNQMLPQTVLSLHADDIDVHLDRFMEQGGVDPTTRSAIRARAVEANRLGPGGVRAAVEEAEDAAYQVIAERHGLDPEVLRRAREENLNRSFGEMQVTLDGRTGNTVFKFLDEEGVLQSHQVPLGPHQTQDYAFLPDLKELDRVAKQVAGHYSNLDVAAGIPDDVLTRFYQVWKPAALLSVRWPARVVGEEQFRIMSKIGAVATMKGAGRGAASFAKGAVTRQPTVAFPSLMSNGQEAMEVIRLKETARWTKAYGATEGGLKDRLWRTTRNWVTLTPDDPNHVEQWVHVVRNQVARSRLGMRLLRNGNDVDDAVRWLTKDPEGIRFAQTSKLRARNPQQWAEAAADQIARYLPTPEARLAARYNKFDRARAEKIVKASRPNIHGQQLDSILGAGKVNTWEWFGDQLGRVMTAISSTPTIHLSRQPFFDAMYQKRLHSLVNTAVERGLELTQPRRVRYEAAARRYALGEARELLFDMAENSRLAEAFRFVVPFMDASREVLTRWAGIAIDNPAFVRRMTVAWKAPENAGFVYDELGRRVDANGYVTDINGRRVKADGERYIRFVAPPWAEDIPVIGEVLRGGITFSKDSVNTILANPFGPGPLVQIAVSKIVDPTPRQKEQWRWLFPYGIGDDAWNTLLPTTPKAFATSPDAPARANLAMYIFNDLAMKWELNGKPEGAKPTMAEAKAIEARVNMMWQVAVKPFSPVGVRTLSPFQAHIDILRQLRDDDPATATQRFYELYGVEFAWLANSVTRANETTPPTIEGFERGERYRDLIEQYPEFGALIVGDVQDRFNYDVYREQLERVIGPEDDRRRRGRVPTAEFMVAPTIEQGWTEFTRYMDELDSIRISRGLQSYQVKAAEDLLAVKNAIIDGLKAEYDGWYDDYQQADPGKAKRRLDGMRTLANDRRLAGREDLAVLRDYFYARDAIGKILTSRKAAGRAGTLEAVANKDLYVTWHKIVATLVESDLEFAALHHRYLDRDAPEPGDG